MLEPTANGIRRVRIHDLVSKPHLNGKIGIIVGDLQKNAKQDDRYPVQIVETVELRANNMSRGGHKKKKTRRRRSHKK